MRWMRLKPALTAMALLAGPGLMSSGLATAAVGLSIVVAPPEPRAEVVPGPRAGWVWAPGYWEWRGRAHVWVPGHWIRERRGYHWVADVWVHNGPQWVFQRGHWERN
jgi:hypothetical protein